MKIKKIKTPEEYNTAVTYLEQIGDRDDFEDNPDLVAEFEFISDLVAIYEKANFQLEAGHPLEIIKLKMDSLGIIQKDLVPLIGSSGVVSDVFNQKRGLSKSMIRNFSTLLHIEQDILNTEYELKNKPVNKPVVSRVRAQFSFIKSTQKDMARAFSNRVRDNGLLFDIAC
ncbi:helix-turn-helix domain-containing protein [Mucilaginibacter sp.]